MAGGRTLPDDPTLATASERTVWAALKSQLREGEVLLSSVRFTDPRNGDVEADFVLLMPELGAAVIEVKGGEVRYQDGQWTTASHRLSTRRIKPVEQARRAKHALRRFLDRQPEWHFPLLRTEWLVAFPMIEVTGDLGPEARRDLIIDRHDLPNAMSIVRSATGSTVNRDPLPDGDWVETALSLLLRTVADSDERARLSQSLRWLKLALLSAGSFLAATAAGWFLGWAAFATTAAAALLVATASWRHFDDSGSRNRGLSASAGAALAGVILGATAQLLPVGVTAGPVDCQPGYTPCLPIKADLDCADIGTQVRVTGDDPYRLDRDGDGVACEWTITKP